MNIIKSNCIPPKEYELKWQTMRNFLAYILKNIGIGE